MPGVITSTTASRQAPPPPASGTLPPAAVTVPPAPEAPPPPQPAAPTAAPTPTTTIAELQASLRQVTLGLQLSRASTMALMRLQLAIRCGDRQQAMEAMDRLDTLDAELERLVSNLPPQSNTDSGNPDPALQTIAKHLEDQKLALAFEKLALASGIVGPDLVSIEKAWPNPENRQEEAGLEPEEHAPPEQVDDTPDLTTLWSRLEEFPAEEPQGLSPRAWGLIMTLLVVVTIAAAVWVFR